MAPKRVSNLKPLMSSWFTPISSRQSSKSPTQSLKVPILWMVADICTPVARYKSLNAPRYSPLNAACALLCLEVCRALFHVCAEAFFGVGTAEEQRLQLA